MSITLTEEQQKQIDADAQRPAEAVDPRTGRRFTLVPSDEYESLRDRLDDEAFARDASRMLGRQLAEES